jgi:hypothetical protein
LLVALGAVGITIAITEYHPPWPSAWFIAGTSSSVLGCVFAIWSLILYLARKLAAGHWCSDPQAHIVQPAELSDHGDQKTEANAQGDRQGPHEKATPSDPVKTGLEVVIDDEKLTPFPGIALIMEIEFHVTNHDPVPHSLRLSARGSRGYFPPPDRADDPEHARVRYAYGTISERRRWEFLPPRIRAGETVRAAYVMEFGWDPTGKLPDYALIVSDGRHEYTARPYGVTETVQEA